MNQPLISVIITTYNRKDIVGKTIKSVLEQSYDNKEVIIVDDNSTDGTDKYFKNHWKSKVKYIRHKQNMGVQYASNTGFEKTSGKYLAFIGDDDVWTDRNKLKRQVEIFEEDTRDKIGIITTSIRIVRSNEKFIKKIDKPNNLVEHLLAKNGIIYGSAALIRRSAFELAGKFDENLPKGTDSDVFRRIVLLGYDVYFIDKAMIDYYEGHNRMTSRTPENIKRTITAQSYVLSKYSHYLECYPKAKAYRLTLLGNDYQDLFLINDNPLNLKVSRKMYIKSFLVYPFDLNSLLKLVKSLKL